MILYKLGGSSCACKEALSCCACDDAQGLAVELESAEWAHPGVDKRFGEPQVSANCWDGLLDVFFLLVHVTKEEYVLLVICRLDIS